MSLVEYALAIQRSPGEAFERLGKDEAAGKLGRAAALMLGLSWAVFFGVLAFAGHAPSQAPAVPIAAEHYYVFEAAIAIPLYLVMWLALSSTLLAVGRALGGQGTGGALRGVAGLCIMLPGLIAWFWPDVLVYAVWGFDAIAPAMRYYVPACVVWTFVLTTIGVRRVMGLSTARAALTAFAGALVYGLIGGPFLR